jgi:hypothetical protein
MTEPEEKLRLVCISLKLLRESDVVEALVLIVFRIFKSLIISTTFAET